MAENPAWDVFVVELRRAMASRGVTSEGLSAALERAASAEVVANWRKGRSRPALHLLPRISRALGMGGPALGRDDPTHLLRRMGLLGSTEVGDLADVSFRTQRLELRRQQLMADVARLERGQVVVDMVRAARRSGTWAIGVRPTVAGPPDCRLHVADEVELSRVDGTPVTHQQVFNDDLWRPLALRGRIELPEHARRSSGAAAPTWLLSALAVPTLPTLPTPHAQIRGVCLYGLTRDSGVNQIAYLMAAALGYGFTSTRSIVLETTILQDGHTTWAERLDAHGSLLRRPKERYVWSHHAPPHPESGPDPFAVTGSDVPVVWLRESDAVLERYCSRWKAATLAAHVEFRAQCDALAAQRAETVRVIDVDWSPDIDERWASMLEVTRQLLASAPYGDALARAESTWLDASLTDRDVSEPFLAWLRRDTRIARLLSRS